MSLVCAAGCTVFRKLQPYTETELAPWHVTVHVIPSAASEMGTGGSVAGKAVFQVDFAHCIITDIDPAVASRT